MVWEIWPVVFRLLVWAPLYAFLVGADGEHCSRYHSRLVRNALREHFFPAYDQHKVDVPLSCLLHETHDVFIRHEINKEEEHVSRWTCNFCGKAFYSEHYIDMHMQNRHKDFLIQDSSVCLADYCDVFRCVVLNDQKKEWFWERALCKHEKMAALKRRCEVLMHGCMPVANGTSDTPYKVYETVWSNVCSLLTCKDYWKPPYEEMPTWRIIVYAVFSPFFVMALIVYYYCVWEYYYGDLFHDSSSEMEQRSDRYVSSW
ncbi:predicted protein, partial [Nematostella vectensis]